MMGSGDKRIDVVTLRRLLPLWMRSAGFDVCFVFGGNKSAEDCMLVDSNERRVRAFLSALLSAVTVTDGCVAYRESPIRGTVLIRVWDGEELGHGDKG